MLKIFVSWSGEASRQVAVALRDWLQSVIQTLDPYVSSEDIEKGARWGTDIAKELEAAMFGILCITPDNLQSPWINFEAGALVRTVETGRVTPLLLGLRPTEVTGPLVQFQATLVNHEDILRLVLSLNRLQSTPLDDERVRRSFDRWWPDLERTFAAIAIPNATSSRIRTAEPSVMDELLDLSRAQQRSLLAIQQQLAAVPKEGDQTDLTEHHAGPSKSYASPSGPLNRRIIGRRILVVDHDPGSLAFIKSTLEASGARLVRVAKGADAALLQMRRQPLDAVITARRIRNRDATWLLAKARAIPCLAPFIVTSTTEVAGSDWKSQGFAGFLQWPLDTEALIELIASARSGARLESED